jgi:hypothetical protein
MYFTYRPQLLTWIGIASIAASIAAVYLHFREVGQLRERMEVVTAERDSAISRLDRAQLAVNTCMKVNLENSSQRDKENLRAKAAEARILEAEHEANLAIRTMQDRIANLRSRNLDCPAIDNEYRDWVRQ